MEICAKGGSGVHEGADQGRRDDKKERTLYGNCGEKMNYFNELEEAFIFMVGGVRGKPVKIVLNCAKRTCIVYSADGDMLMKLDNMTPRRMNEIKKQIKTAIQRSKNPFRFAGRY